MNDSVLARAFWSLGLLLAWLWLQRRRLSLNPPASTAASLMGVTLLPRTATAKSAPTGWAEALD